MNDDEYYSKHKPENNQPLDNTVLPDSVDWWYELCKANNEENHFKQHGENNED